MPKKLILIAICVLCWSPSWVLADAVPPPPTDCRAGSTGETGHSGPYCSPNKICTSDADCNGGTCAQVSFCLTKDPGCGGRPLPDGGPNCFPFDKVTGDCSQGASACGTGATCDTNKRCFAQGTNPPPADGGGGTKDGGTANDTTSDGGPGGVTSVCGCSSASLPVGSLLLLLFMGVFLYPSRRAKAER